MTSVTDSIMNSLLVIAVLLVLGVIVTSAVLQDAARSTAQDRNVLLEERSALAVGAFLQSTENMTGDTMAELIGRSIYDLRTVFDENGTAVDVVNETELRLDAMFGPGNYYMDIDPIVKGVNLMFVLDSSPTVDAERQVIAEQLGAIREEIEADVRERTGQEEDVYAQVLMLPGSAGDDCASFRKLAKTECRELTQESLYDPLLEEGWELPSFEYIDYDAWASKSHYAMSEDFAESDWAAGVATAALQFEQDAFLRDRASINFIFPLSDELSTTSKSNECFGLEEQGDFLICQMCQGECPTERSRKSIEQAAELLQGGISRVYPIYSVDCDFNYAEGFNSFSQNANDYMSQFMDGAPFTPADYPGTTWCSQDACGGCSVESVDPVRVCFHDNCFAELQSQMGDLAQRTGGSLIDVNDAGQIPSEIRGAFDEAVQEYDFSVGVRDESRDRFVYEKVVPLPNDVLAKIRLWVYAKDITVDE